MTFLQKLGRILRSWWKYLVHERLGYRRSTPPPISTLTTKDFQLRYEVEQKLRQVRAMEVYLEARKDVLWTKGGPYV